MIISRQPRVDLTYCLNVHPGESFQDQWDAAKTCAVKVRNSLTNDGTPFGLGLRLGHKAILEAGLGNNLHSFAEWCRDHNMYVFTLNGFPYGDFHQGPVKASVYRPDWTKPERRDYTMALANGLAEWLPEGVCGSISTVPCWYAPDYPDDSAQSHAIEHSVRHLIETAHHLEQIAARTGKEICLALEPEPWCFLETSDDVVAFYHDHLLAGQGNEIEKMLHRRVGVCIDTCHAALAFEQPVDVLHKMTHQGIRIAKIQLSAALAFNRYSGIPATLHQFNEPVYFHQTALSGSMRGVQRWPDLPEALEAMEANNEGGEARVHFHVPLHWEGDRDGLGSTRHNMEADFWKACRQGICPHLEIETYTFHVLPDEMTRTGLIESIVNEYRWVLPKLAVHQS